MRQIHEKSLGNDNKRVRVGVYFTAWTGIIWYTPLHLNGEKSSIEQPFFEMSRASHLKLRVHFFNYVESNLWNATFTNQL